MLQCLQFLSHRKSKTGRCTLDIYKDCNPQDMKLLILRVLVDLYVKCAMYSMRWNWQIEPQHSTVRQGSPWPLVTRAFSGKQGIHFWSIVLRIMKTEPVPENCEVADGDRHNCKAPLTRIDRSARCSVRCGVRVRCVAGAVCAVPVSPKTDCERGVSAQGH